MTSCCANSTAPRARLSSGRTRFKMLTGLRSSVLLLEMLLRGVEAGPVGSGGQGSWPSTTVPAVLAPASSCMSKASASAPAQLLCSPVQRSPALPPMTSLISACTCTPPSPALPTPGVHSCCSFWCWGLVMALFVGPEAGEEVRRLQR